VLTFHVESRIVSTPTGPGSAVKSELRLGKIHLVDLAGSERLALSGAEGDTRLETQNINLALSALGTPGSPYVLFCFVLFVRLGSGSIDSVLLSFRIYVGVVIAFYVRQLILICLCIYLCLDDTNPAPH
jgi:hypothetical protein